MYLKKLIYNIIIYRMETITEISNDTQNITLNDFKNHIKEFLASTTVDEDENYLKAVQEMSNILQLKKTVIDDVKPKKKSIVGRPKKIKEIKEKKVTGRPRKQECDKLTADPDYYKNYLKIYYKEKCTSELQCDHCGKYITKTNLSRHKKGLNCTKTEENTE